jgi:uncharacterized glyoxalase superfamily protein PhnB
MGILPGYRQFYTVLGCGFIRESSMMQASIAVFTVKDVLASLAYFRDKLGFDVDALHADLVKRGARALKAPKDYDYGLRDFDVADLDGNMIFFGMESQKAS